MSEFEELEFTDDVESSAEMSSKTPASTKVSEVKGDKLFVYFQSTIGPGNRQEKLIVSDAASIDDIKYTVSQIFGLPKDEFHLSSSGRTMNVDDTLKDYEVENGDTILLIPVSTAGVGEFEDLSMDFEEPKSIKSKTPASSKTPAGNKQTVYFQSTIGPSQKQEKMTVATTAPVGDIKYTVSQVFGLPAEEFHLSHAGRTMDPDDTLENYGVENGDTVLLIPVSTAGSGKDFEDLSIDFEEPKSIKSKTPASSKTPAGNKQTVYFQSTIGPSQKQEKMTVATTAPVGDIKYTVSQVFGLPAEEFHLSHAGRTMDPDDTLENYGVENGDTVLLIPVSTAGAL